MKRIFLYCVLCAMFFTVPGVAQAGLNDYLVKAAQEGDIEQARELLERGADPNGSYKFNLFPLHEAAARGHIEMVRLLLAKGANINAYKSGDTPLCEAAKKGHTEVARLLLAKGADVNGYKNYDGKYLHPPLSYAKTQEMVELLLARGAAVQGGELRYAHSKEAGALELLISRGANVNFPKDDPPIFWIIRKGNVELLRLLISKGADVNTKAHSGRTPLHYSAAELGRLEMLKLLLSRGADVNAKNDYLETPLHRAANVDVVRLLVRAGADVNAKDKYLKTPLHKAANADVAKFLVAQGANARAEDKNNHTPLYYAKSRESVEFFLSKGVPVKGDELFNAAWKEPGAIELLIAKGADVNCKGCYGWTPLMRFSRSQNCKKIELKSIKLLLDHGADIHARDGRGKTPLHWIAKGSIPEALALLIAKGADVNCKTKGGWTPLHAAALYTDEITPFAVLKLLVEKGADVNAKTKKGLTPLHQAGTLEKAKYLISKGAVRLPHPDPDLMLKEMSKYEMYGALYSIKGPDKLRLLMIRGGNVNAVDKKGNTLVHKAITEKLPDDVIIALLLEKGAKVDAANIYGDTPLHVAVRYRRDAKAVLLIKSGADINARCKLRGKNKDKEGPTLLHEAVRRDLSQSLITLLLSKGAAVNAKDHKGFTPLHAACADGLMNLVSLLIVHGADVNAANEKGRTPLHAAAEGGHFEAARLLVAKGADTSMKDARGSAPWKIAEQKKHTRLAAWLGEMSGDRAQEKNKQLDRLIKDTAGSEYSVETGSGWYVDTIKKAVNLVKSMPMPPEIPAPAREHMSRARAALKTSQGKEELKAAKKEYLKAACAAPWWPAPYYNTALVQEKLHEYMKAGKLLQFYLAADQDAKDAGAVRGKIHELELLAKKKIEAEKHINRAADLYNKGDTHSAIAENKKAIRLAPYYGISHANLGVAYEKLKRHKEAIPELEEAIRLEYISPYVYTSLAVAYRNLGDVNKAITVLEEGRCTSSILGNGWGFMIQKLGKYYEGQGNYSKALESYSELLKAIKTAESFGRDMSHRSMVKVDKAKVEERVRALKRRLGR